MLAERGKFYAPLLLVADVIATVISWYGSYFLRFYTDWVPAPKGIPDLSLYTLLLPAALVIYPVTFGSFGAYREMRLSGGFGKIFGIARSVTVAQLFVMAIAYMLRPYQLSRLVWIYFYAFEISTIWLSRTLIITALKEIRRRGRNLIRVLVVGAGDLGCQVADRLDARPELGIKVVGFISRHEEKVGCQISCAEVLGSFENLDSLIAEHKIATVIVALPMDAHQRIRETLTHLSDATVNVMIVPDLYQYMTLHGGIEEFEGLPVIRLQDTPLIGWNAIFKRSFDIAFSSLVLLLGSPFYLALALGVKLSSPGPVFYRQERMGLDGACFGMMKYRSMRVDAEQKSGAVWAEKDDPRRTRFGTFIRRFSLDELPQFINVLKGDMSVVGPRPERPVFIDKFRKNIPKYMLRHKVKAGITGWAQVSGLRGNTSLERRIEYDLYYIENWSFLLDIKIILLTVWRVIYDPNAY